RVQSGPAAPTNRANRLLPIQQVAGRRRQADGQPVKLLGDNDLAAEARGGGQPEGEVEHVLLVLGRVLQQLVPLGIDDDMAGRTGERTLARAFDVDIVAVGDLVHQQAERGTDLAPGPVALDKNHTRHHSPSARGAKSAARIAAAIAGASPVDGTSTRSSSI